MTRLVTARAARRRAIAIVAVAVAIFVSTCAYRYLTLGGRIGGLDNDEFVVLAYGQQLLMGDHAVSDYIEPGRPLQHWMLAASQEVFGPTLLPPIALSLIMLAASTVALFVLAAEASGSILVAAAVAALQILMAPRFYNYPKVLAYAIGIPLVWWYMTKPGRGRLFGVAAAGVVAFLLRHDHGAYMALAGVVGVALAHLPDHRRALRAVVELGAMALVLVLPYVVYVSAHTTLPAYVRASIEFGKTSTTQTQLHELPPFDVSLRRPLVTWLPPPPPAQPHINATWRPGISASERGAREQALGMVVDNAAGRDTFNYKLTRWSNDDLRAIVNEPLIVGLEGINRQTLETEAPRSSRRARVLDVLSRFRPLPGLLNEANATAFLFYLFIIPPLAALAAIAIRRDAFEHEHFVRSAPKMAVVAVLSIAMMMGLLRGNLNARFADVSESCGIMIAAVCGLLLRRPPGIPRACGAAAVVLLLLGAAYAVQMIEQVPLQIWRTGIDRGRQAVWIHAKDVYRAYTAHPPVSAWDPREDGSVSLAAFINRCTQPDDRLLIVGYLPEVLVLSARGFANGTPWILPGFFESREDQQLMLERTRTHRVPIAVTVSASEYDEDYVPLFRQIDAYLRSNYREIDADSHAEDVRILAARGLEPVRTDAITGFPCYAP